MKLTLTLDIEQLGILMNGLEACWGDNITRTREALAEEVEEKAKRWTIERDTDGFMYEVVKATPVYLQLLAVWQSLGMTPAGGGWVWTADTRERFDRAYCAARHALGAYGGVSPAVEMTAAESSTVRNCADQRERLARRHRGLCDRAAAERRPLTAREVAQVKACCQRIDEVDEQLSREFARLDVAVAACAETKEGVCR